MGCDGDFHANAEGIQYKFDRWLCDNWEFPEFDIAVFRRELPYMGNYPDLVNVKERIESNGCDVKTIWVMRNWEPMLKSTRYRHPERGEGTKLFDMAMLDHLHIMKYISNLQPFTIFNSSVFFIRPEEVLRHLCDFTGLDFPREKFDQIKWNTDSKWDHEKLIMHTETCSN